jgi:hypothetical protein
MGVPALHKPRGQWCPHACAAGCNIYATRPEECHDYECVWLTSQRSTPPLPPTLKPSVCGALINLSRDQKTMVIDFDPASTKFWAPGGTTPLAKFVTRVSMLKDVLVRKGKRTLVVRKGAIVQDFEDARPYRIAAGLDPS